MNKPSFNSPVTPGAKKASSKRTPLYGIIGGCVLICGLGGSVNAYLSHREQQRQEAEKARLLEKMEARHQAEMELRTQQLQKRLAAKEEEMRNEARRAEERTQAWKHDQDEAKRQAEEQRHKEAEAKRLAQEKKQQELKAAEERRQQAAELLKAACQAAKEGKEAEAVKLYGEAVEHGSAEAAHDLGVRYMLGKGTKKNPTEGARLYKISAEGGYAEGELAYGSCLLEGRGVTKDTAQGLEWLEKAASHGLQEARELREKFIRKQQQSPIAVSADHRESVNNEAARMYNLIVSAPCRNGMDRAFRSKLKELFSGMAFRGAGVNEPLPGETNTALHYACAMNQASVVEWLLNHGASPYTRNQRNESPADCARAQNSTNALEVLRRHGVNY